MLWVKCLYMFVEVFTLFIVISVGVAQCKSKMRGFCSNEVRRESTQFCFAFYMLYEKSSALFTH